jgi:hypothetical protein
MYETLSQFVHRPNVEGSFTSICARCFGTAGSGKVEAELEKAEKQHVCKKEVLRLRAKMSN